MTCRVASPGRVNIFVSQDKAFEKERLHGETLMSMWQKHRHDEHGLLHGMRFVLKEAHPKMPDDQLATVIRSHDGEVLPSSSSLSTPGKNTSVIVLTQAKRAVSDYADRGHPIYSYDFVFDGIFQQTLGYDKHFLTPKPVASLSKKSRGRS